MVVPFPAGGGTDVIARIVTERMRTSLGRPIIIENVGGALGTLGVGRVARAAPDGYTLTLGNFNTHVTNGALYALSYDVLNDFEPVTLVTTQPYLIVAKAALPAHDLNGLIAWLRANPNKASASTQGLGGSSQIAGVFFQNVTGTSFQFVPYRGGAQAVQDLVGGQVDLTITSSGEALAYVRAGSIKAYAVLAKTRLAAAPDIPTVDEAGLPGFYFSSWFGLWAPKGTQKDIVARLNAAVVEALADPRVRARLADLGQEIFPRDQQTPEALAALQKAEIAKWWPIIKEAGIKAQ
jgi:tripartite-type tricarboxylate transporter receptor subunit TctC